MDQRDQGTFRERIARNRRNSLLLIAAFLAFVTIFGYIIGFAWLGDPTRALFGLALALLPVAGWAEGNPRNLILPPASLLLLIVFGLLLRRRWRGAGNAVAGAALQRRIPA